MTPSNTPVAAFVVCSIQENRLEQLRTSLDQYFGKPYQLIHIGDAASLCEGYNRGLKEVKAEITIFCHDDILLTKEHFADALSDALKEADIVGVAGCSKLTEGKWVSAGFPYLHGHLVHHAPQGNPRYVNYGCARDEARVPNILALDGCFIAAKTSVAKQIGFDEKTFDGFHLYDLDFCFRAYQQGLKLMVDYGLQIVHTSSGNWDNRWRRYRGRFNRKFRGSLSPIGEAGLAYYSNREFETREQAVAAMHAYNPQARILLCPEGSEPPALRNGTLPVIRAAEDLDPNQHIHYVRDITTAHTDLAEHLQSLFDRLEDGAVVEWSGSNRDARILFPYCLNGGNLFQNAWQHGYRATWLIQAMDQGPQAVVLMEAVKSPTRLKALAHRFSLSL